MKKLVILKTVMVINNKYMHTENTSESGMIFNNSWHIVVTIWATYSVTLSALN